MEPLASDDNDGEHIWVMMPRAAVEKLAVGPESRSNGDTESDISVT